MNQCRLSYLGLITCVLLSAGCAGGQLTELVSDSQPGFAATLPSLDECAARTDVVPLRSVSDNSYQLLDSEPVMTSGNGSAVHADGELTLDPALGDGVAWAVYALSGLPADDTEYPTGLAISKGAARVWLGTTNYGSDRWDLYECQISGGMELEAGLDLVRDGAAYFAVLATDGLVTIDGLEVTTTAVVPGGDFRELLIIYNSDIPADLELANYYGSAETGRGIDPEYRLGLALGADGAQLISRENYGQLIRDPLIAFLDSHPAIESNIKYLLLMKGVPHQIDGEEDLNSSDGISTMCSSVDSELCTLYSGGVEGPGYYPLVSYLWNGVDYMQPPSDPRTLFESSSAFVPHYFKASAESGGTCEIDYLVGRLSAYTYEEARALVDRSLAADTSGTGWTIFDSSNALIGSTPMNYYDTMVDPVYPYGVDTKDSGYELLFNAGFNVFADITTEQIVSTTPGLPAGAAANVIAYCSWGQHAGMASEYILNDLGFTYRAGACFMSYESFNGSDFDDSDGIQRRGQGQVADFLRMGGTVGIGNAWEPFDRGIGDERWTYDRYLHYGDRWIEAAYKGMRTLSWQEVVVGDPLCRVVAP